MHTTRHLIAAIAGLALLPAVGRSANAQWASELGYGQSDNIRRTEISHISESIAQADLEFSAEQKIRSLNAELSADLAYLNYRNGTYDNEVIGNASGEAVATLLEDHLRWTAIDNFGQTQRDLFAAVTPDNRENINYFTTGPDLLLRLGSRGQVQLGGRYSRVDYQTSPFDSNRYSGTLALSRTLAENSALSLNLQHERVAYSVRLASSADFDNSALYAAYNASGQHTKLTLNAGTNRINRSGVAESGLLLGLTMTRDLSARSTMNLNVGQDLTDAASTFGSAGATRNVSLDTQSLTTSNNPFKHRYVGLGWDATGRRTRLGVSVSYIREAYLQQSVLDRDRGYGEFHLARDMGSRFTMRVLGSYAKDHFKRAVGDSDEVTATAGLAWRLSRQFRLDLSLDHYDRNSEVVGGDSVENRYWLRLRYGEAQVRGVGAFSPR